MKLKEIVYPYKLNLIIFVILFIILTPLYQVSNPFQCDGYTCPRYGFPFAFLETQACMVVSGPFNCLMLSQNWLLYLIYDILILYGTTVLINLIYKKIK